MNLPKTQRGWIVIHHFPKEKVSPLRHSRIPPPTIIYTIITMLGASSNPTNASLGNNSHAFAAALIT